MANRKRHHSSHRLNSVTKTTKRKSLRRSVLESLEKRQLLALGPQLVGIEPDTGELITDGSVRHDSPGELVFRFDENQVIDPATLDAIRIVRSGGDGTFGLPVASSDFGSVYRDPAAPPSSALSSSAEIQLSARSPIASIRVLVERDETMLPGDAPVMSIETASDSSQILNISLAPGTNAFTLVSAINGSSSVSALVSAQLKGGHRDAVLMRDPSVSALPAISLSSDGDVEVIPTFLQVGDAPNQNEVIARFSQALPQDNYRVEVFGFDDSDLGIVGLRNLSADGSPGELLVSRTAGSKKEQYEFKLELGARVEAVVPQPVVRLDDGSLSQRREEVVVYFNDDDLFVENSGGVPTERSAENPRFYTLIYTDDSVSNRDDVEIAPVRVVYNPSADTATLIFSDDLSNLVGGKGGKGTYRLRVGTAETLPFAPQRLEFGAAVGATDLNSGGQATLRFQATSSAPSGVKIVFANLTSTGVPTVSVSGTLITVNTAGGATFDAIAAAINNDPAASSLVLATVDGIGSTLAGNGGEVPAPVSLLEPGDHFDAAADLGTLSIVPGDVNFRSIILSSAIDPINYNLELPGGNDDPGHRDLVEDVGSTFVQHVNDNFGADTVAGISTIAYNFRSDYGVDSSGTARVNSITERQKQRIREGLDLWASKLGVQFYETDNQGITFATGDLSVLPNDDNTYARANFGVHVDPNIATSGAATNAILVMDSQVEWKDLYGESYFRTSVAGIGFILGLEVAENLPASTVMNLDPTFLSDSQPYVGAWESFDEPIFPGNYDILHGQYLWRPESGDIDLYRFEVDLDDPDKKALVSAETFAERLSQSSLLDTELTLYQQKQASLVTDFGVYGDFYIRLTAVQPGALGNRTGITLVTTPAGNPTPTVEVNENQIYVYMTDPSAVTVKALVDAINASPAAANLMVAQLVLSDDVDPADLPTLAGLQEDAPAFLLTGGGIEAVARNDDYYSEDSYLEAELGSGVYYLGVTASGNDIPDPTIADTGFGGTTQGKYEVLLKFRPQVDETDTLRDLDGNNLNSGDPFRLPGTPIDGDNDGLAGGVNNFWFQSRPLDRRLEFVNGGDAIVDGQVIEITDYRGITRRFQFTTGSVASNRIKVPYSPTDSPSDLATKFKAAIDSSGLATSVVLDGTELSITGDQTIKVPNDFVAMEVLGRTIFVDNFGGPNADGSLARPFDSIAGLNVPNAFKAAHEGDIVRIVGNGGNDLNPATLGDNFGYELGYGSLPGQVLQDGTEMEIPKGVTTMIDANAIFKMRRSYIGVGSSSLLVDRSGGALQVLGTPTLVDDQGAVIRDAMGNPVDGAVYFTSYLDRSIATPNAGPSTTPKPGDWGGIIFRRDIDNIEGRADLEGQGIFLQHVGNADIRYGGGSNIVIDGIQQLVNPIQIVDMRPTIARNNITLSADAAISATPDSFLETNFQTSEYQFAGAFTADYDRVGPDVYGNQLVDNSINGMFIRANTPAGGTLRSLTIAGRFDDTDVVHVISENLIVEGSPGGPRLYENRLAINLVDAQAASGGSLVEGQTYEYRLLSVDLNGRQTLPSDPIIAPVLTAGQGTLALNGLPPAEDGFTFRRLYRSRPDGRYDLVATLDATEAFFVDRGEALSTVPVELDTTSTGVLLGRLDASLKIDPGSVIKMQGARIEFEFGTQLLAEGLEDQQIIITSLLDDRYGAGGEFDTNNSGPVDPNSPLAPKPGDWGGLYFAPTAHVSLDHGVVAYGGGLTRIEGTFRAFSAIELQQATGRIAHSTFEKNHEGLGGQGPVDRLGRLDNVAQIVAGVRGGSTIFVRGSQPVIVGNVFIDNGKPNPNGGPTLSGSAINIDGNSLTDQYIVDIGRNTGLIDRISEYDDNYGPLLRDNRFRNNGLNGLEIRGRDRIFVGGREFVSEGNYLGGTYEYIVNSYRNTISGGINLDKGEIADSAVVLTTRSIWDDTDIVHIPYQQIITSNLHSSSGLRLQSRPGQSLVVKFGGQETTTLGKNISPGSIANPYYGGGFTATGSLGDISDRVGGSLQIVGVSGAPVVITSLSDDTIGASLQPDGTTQTDTNNDWWGSRPEENDWRGILLDEFSNDRNVDTILERETHNAPAPGLNASTINPEVLGDLASNFYDSDENLRLGFDVTGFLTENDVDVYAFTASAGTEVWIDIDRTTYSLDSIIEVLDPNGDLLARSTSSSLEDYQNFGLRDEQLGPLQKGTDDLNNYNDFGLLDEYGTTNIRDAGFRVSLPGVRGARETYFVRIRAGSVAPDDYQGGLTAGKYELQVRMQEDQEFAGSTVRYADIRYAHHGVHTRGLPYHSPLLGEAQEDESDTNGISNDRIFTDVNSSEDRAQYLGNLLDSDRTVLSVGGALSNVSDVDFYQFDIVNNNGERGTHFPTVLDIDYADDLGRPDTTLWLYYDPDGQSGGVPPQLVYAGYDSNLSEDRSLALNADLLQDFARGSVGAADPFIGPAELPEGTYFVAVTESSYEPAALANDPSLRREPIASIKRLIDDHIDSYGGTTAAPPSVPSFVDQNALPGGWVVTTSRGTETGHGVYATFDGARDGVSPDLAIQSEVEYNSSINAANSIDNQASWSTGFNSDITGINFPYPNTSTFIPHTTIKGVLSDSADFFQFEVPAGIPRRVILDIDDAYDYYQFGFGINDLDLALFSIDTPPTAPLFTGAFASGGDPGGSTFATFYDPAIDQVIPPGRYAVAVIEDGAVFDANTGTYSIANSNVVNGSYTLNVSVDGHPINADSGSSANESLYFNPASGNGALTTNAFDLSGYTANDLPNFYFTYALATNLGDEVTVRVNTPDNPGGTVVATNTGASGALLVSDNLWRQAKIDLAPFAGKSDVTVTFEYSSTGGLNTGLYLDDFIVGFAEHGELISGSSYVTGSNTTFIQTGTPGTFTSGAYQLEIRPGTDYGSTVGSGLNVRETFDTNDRQSESVTLLAPEGARIQDGDFFEISDGFVSQAFEFNSVGGVKLGRVAVPFTPTSTAAEVAASIIAAINSPAVQAKASFSASSSGGITSGNTGGDNRIELYGSVSGDFNRITEEQLVFTPAADTDSEMLAASLAGSGVTITPTTASLLGSAASFTGGTEVLGMHEGILLTNGENTTIAGPNIDTNTSGTALGFGDPDADSLGITSVDHSVLEFQMDFDPLPPGSTTDLYLQLAYASEEFLEGAVNPDIAAVFITDDDGVFVPMKINGADYISSDQLSNVVNNDPSKAGKFLNEFSFDGISRVMTASITGIDPSVPRIIRIVVADNTTDSGDSAVLIKAGSLSTTAPSDSYLLSPDGPGRVQLPAKIHTGSGDINARREQGQVLIQSNTISNVLGYGVWVEGADHEQDPEDFRADGSAAGFGDGRPQRNLGQPALGRNYGGAVRNLRALNDSVEGGLVPGPVIENNIIYQAQTAAITTQNNRNQWVIETLGSDPDDTDNLEVHWGDGIWDGALMDIWAGDIRVRFEFEDISGDILPDRGSAVLGGNGVSPGNVPIYYRKDVPYTIPASYLDSRNWGYSEHEMLAAIYDAIIGSVLVTNDTQALVRPVLGPSVIENSITPNIGAGRSEMAFENPALYIEGVSEIRLYGGTYLLDARQMELAESPQQFVRIVNNTIYGTDGDLSQSPGSVLDEPNDTLAGAVDTRLANQIDLLTFTQTGTIGDSTLVPADQDVDLFRFALSEGDRAEIATSFTAATTVGGNNGGAVLRLFNSHGEEVASTDPGVNLLLDFTAKEKDTYYVGVSSAANSTYDTESLAGRHSGGETGQYNMQISLSTPKDYVLSIDSLRGLDAGDRVTITDVTGQSATFTVSGSDRPWDQARDLADDINQISQQSVTNPNPRLLNHERNRGPDGISGPIGRVVATALGGADGDQPGVDEIGTDAGPLWSRPDHPFFGSGGDSQNGFGHDREPPSLGDAAGATRGQPGTSELFVFIKNAASVSINGIPQLSTVQRDRDELIPSEMGVFVRDASPTLLNNVFMNLRTGVFDQTTEWFPTIQVINTRAEEVIIGNNIFQGIAKEYSNVNANDVFTDFNDILDAGDTILTNPTGGNFIPNQGSVVIDSSIDSLLERDQYKSYKDALGIAPSPLLAPQRDVFGLLRADDPTVTTPPGIGGNVFKDRGAVDRADFVGPGAALIVPYDNDVNGTDTDSTVTRVDLQSAPPTEFRIRLQDVADSADPFVGSHIDADTVVNSVIDSLRESGAALTLFENGKLLEETVDYSFRYDASTEVIILTPLAGQWKPDAVYKIALNNRDRFVVFAPSGSQTSDGGQFVINDNTGGSITFEYDTGYQLQLPEDLTLLVPASGGGAGGVRDGDLIRVTSPDGLNTTTFEMDRDGSTLAGNVPIAFTLNDSQADIISAINAAMLQRISFPLESVTDANNGVVSLVPKDSTPVNVTFEPSVRPLTISTSGNKTLLQVDPKARVFDGDLIQISSASGTFVFEIDTNGSTKPGNRPVNIANAADQQSVATSIANAINRAASDAFPFELVNTPVGGQLTLTPKLGVTASVTTTFASRIPTTVVDGAIQLHVSIATQVLDGDLLRIQSNGTEFVFEVDTDGAVANGHIPLTFTGVINQQEIVRQIVSTLRSYTFSIIAVQTASTSDDVAPGELVLSAAAGTVIDTSSGSIDQPGSTLALEISSAGVSLGGVEDGQTLTINDGNRIVTFEFDNDSVVSAGNVPIDIAVASTPQTLAGAIATAIVDAGLNASPRVISDHLITLGLESVATVTSSDNGVLVVGYAQPLEDGDGFRMTRNGVTVEFQYHPDVLPPDNIVNFDLDGNGSVDLSIPADINSDSIADVYTRIDRNNDGHIDSLGINADGVVQIDSLGVEIYDYLFQFDANFDGILDYRFNLPVAMTNPFEADFNGDLELDFRFPLDFNQDGLADRGSLIDANDNGFFEAYQYEMPGFGNTDFPVLTISIDPDDDGQLTPRFYPTQSPGFYEADYNGDGVLDVRFPMDINRDGIDDIRTLIYADGTTSNNDVSTELRVPTKINIEANGSVTYPIDPLTGLADLSNPLPDYVVNVDVDGPLGTSDGIPDQSIEFIYFNPLETIDQIADRTAQEIAAFESVFDVQPQPIQGGLISIGGDKDLMLSVIDGSPIRVSGLPGVSSNLELTIAGPLVLQVPNGGATSLPTSSTFTVTNNGQTSVFEFTINGFLSDPNHIAIPYSLGDSMDVVATNIQTAINATAGLGLTARTAPGGEVLLDSLDISQVIIPAASTLTKRIGTVSDGEYVTVSNGTRSVTFEFEDSFGGGGVAPGNQAVVFNSNGTTDDAAATLAAAIASSVLGISTSVDGSTVTLDGATAATTIRLSPGSSISVSGVAGGAVAVPVIRSDTFTDLQVRDSIIDAINHSSASGTLFASVRGDNTIFVEGATTISEGIENYYLRSIADNVGNPLKSNQIDDTTSFTILLAGAQYDYGDAPDPVEDVPGRYPTLREHDGARHLILPDGPRLGVLVDADADGQPQRDADGDDASLVVETDDVIGSAILPLFLVSNADPAGPTVTVNASFAEIPASMEGRLLYIDNGIERLTFEVDSDGIYNEDHIRIAFDPDGEFGPITTPSILAGNLVAAVKASGLELAGIKRDPALASVVLIADDEDGLTLGTPDQPTSVLRQGVETLFNITVTGSGLLDGWVDFNRDGDWDDPGERIFNHVPVSEDSPLTQGIMVPTTLPILASIEGVTTMIRLRFSTDGVSSPIGLALDGEVEDYAVRMINGQVTAVNDGGSAYTVIEDNSLSIPANGVLNNDLVRPGATLQVYADDTGTFELSGGTLTLRGDGSFDYVPNANFNGTDTFTYRAVDQSLLDATGELLVTDPATVTITVVSVNDPPSGGVLNPQFSTNEDFPLDLSFEQILTNDTPTTSDDFVPGPPNESDQTLTVELGAGAGSSQGGTLRITGDHLIYTPPAGFNGTDTFVYRVVDNGVPPRGVNVTATVVVGAANDPPVLRNHSIDLAEDTVYRSTDHAGTLPNGLLTGAFDPENAGPLFVISTFTTSTLAGGFVTQKANGDFDYRPPANYSGPDSFTYTVRDADGGINSADVIINVTQVDDPPESTGLPITIGPLTEDGVAGYFDLDTAFTDPDIPYGDQLSYYASVVPTNKVNVNITGPLLTVTPLADANGQVVITITARDTQKDTPDFQRTITVSVNAANDPPEIVTPINSQVVPEDSVIAPINLSNVFSDPDGDALNFTVLGNTNQSLVSWSIVQRTVNGVLTPYLELTLSPDAYGQSVITVQASDPGGLAVTDQFELTVLPRPDAPHAGNDFYPNDNVVGPIPKGGVFQLTDPSVGLLANDYDADGDAFTIISYTQPRYGTVTVDTSNGTFVYTNTSGRTGTLDSFTYTIQDANQLRDTATVNLTIGDALLTHHNPVNSMDVSADGKVSPIDALLVINLLSEYGTGSIPVLSLDPAPPYYDVSGDAYVTPLDALLVLNELNSRGGSISGEAPATSRLVSSVTVGREVVNTPQWVTSVATSSVATPSMAAPVVSASNSLSQASDPVTGELGIDSLGIGDSATDSDASPLDWSVIADDVRNEPLDSVLDWVTGDAEDHDPNEFADSFDAAIYQLLGENRQDE